MYLYLSKAALSGGTKVFKNFGRMKTKEEQRLQQKVRSRELKTLHSFLLASLFACLCFCFVCLFLCLLACLLVCFLTCLLACFLACLLPFDSNDHFSISGQEKCYAKAEERFRRNLSIWSRSGQFLRKVRLFLWFVLESNCGQLGLCC